MKLAIDHEHWDLDDVTSTQPQHSSSSRWSSEKSVEPCACAPTAELDDPMHPRDWEMPDNRRLLFEQEVHRTNGGDSSSIAWLTVYHGCDGDRDNHNDDSPCRFIVVLNDLLADSRRSGINGCGKHDITSTLLGQYLLQAWKALNPDKLTALPSTYKEWRERERRSAFKDMAAEVEGSDTDIKGMAEADVYECWKSLIRIRRPAELESQGWSPEEVAQKISEEFRGW